MSDAPTPYAEVIGDPIAHSRSPLIHRFWLERAGLEADYRAHRVAPDDLASYLTERRSDPDWRGCNVTLPHKLAILDLVDDAAAVRDSVGAANTVLRRPDDTLFATNTDPGGFWAPLSDRELAGQPVIVIGGGGAARAVLWALAQVGVGPVTVLNRNVLKASALLARFGLKGRALPLDAPLPPAALLVNASALGMAGQPPLPLDLDPLPEGAVVYDLVYAPLQTDLLAQASARGLETIDGLEMLVAQAALAFELLFGVAPPRDDDEALRERLTGG